MNPFSYNMSQLAAQLAVTGNVGTKQPAVQFPVITPACTAQLNSTAAATATVLLFVGPTANGPWVQAGSFSLTDAGNAPVPVRSTPYTGPGNWWAVEISAATGDTTATIDFYMEG